MGRKKESKDHEDEKKLQALLLADSFTNTFRPMTLEKPKMLCPLVGIPMLDYTIELLASSGVQELFVFCVNKADQMNDYIAKSHWPTTIQVTCIQSTVESVGEALREVDNRGVIRSDPFILVSGDVISNMDLKEAIRAHQENRSLDSYCVMTKVFKPVGGSTKLTIRAPNPISLAAPSPPAGAMSSSLSISMAWMIAPAKKMTATMRTIRNRPDNWT